jgi:hypothetical protein
MRAKGSDRNKQIAASFVDCVVRHNCNHESNFICCHGSRSLFAIFSKCFPEISRKCKKSEPENTHGVSMVELNKILVKAGYKICRKREPVPGSHFVNKPGARRWKFRKWIDSSISEDLEHLNHSLAALQQTFPESRHLNVEFILHTISLLGDIGVQLPEDLDESVESEIDEIADLPTLRLSDASNDAEPNYFSTILLREELLRTQEQPFLNATSNTSLDCIRGPIDCKIPDGSICRSNNESSSFHQRWNSLYRKWFFKRRY